MSGGKTEYPIATLNSVTERGGRVSKVFGNASLYDLGIACVGDIVSYEDGTEATIIDGAGLGAVFSGKPVALVGSRLSNGDRIVKSTQTTHCIVEHEGRSIPGLFDPNYVPPAIA
ncbi:PAAR domain-containing protein [Ralstonia sp. 25C]|uniref:PAAR domain-containing protein n=1 Tax=Ralstonia sp. 25C TaxID=3447363 RepID=UPI003F7542C9